jgi:uncharacterized cupredoxin-like copper-binding protein
MAQLDAGGWHVRVAILAVASALSLGNPTAQTPAQTVSVTLSEWKVDMPTSLPAGAYTFKVTNTGKHAHTLKITGEGFEKELSKKLKEGEVAEWTIDLKPGRYTAYCPIGFGPISHKSHGMTLDLTITAART